MKRIILCWVFFILMGFGAWSQSPTYYLNPAKKLTQFKFEHWTTEDGLPTNSLMGICQTKDGYLWISSYNGLIRFDGNQFVVYNRLNTPSFKGNIIRDLREDASGRLWITTQESGLVYYQNGKFQSFQPKNDTLKFCRGLHIDKTGKIWSSSPGKGWFYIENDDIHYLKSDKQLDNYEVSYIDEDKNGGIWFATVGDGLFRYQNGLLTAFTTENGLASNYVYTLYSDNEGLTWIGTDLGINCFDGKNISKPKNNIDGKVNNIVKDNNGQLWVGTIQGLYRMNTSTDEFDQISIANGLADNFIIDFIFDFEGNFWITHYKSGLLRIKDGKFNTYSYNSGLLGKLANTVCQLDDNTVLVGLENGKLTLIKENNFSAFKTKRDLSGARIRHIMKDSGGNIWISTYEGLLKILPNKNEVWFSEENGFPDSKIRLTFEDSKGTIWVGTRNSGIVKIKPDGSYSNLNSNDGLTSNLIMAIAEDQKGTILVGTSEGNGALNLIRNGSEIETITARSGMDTNVIFNFNVNENGQIWIASNDGLFLWRDDKFYNFTTLQGLADDAPYDVLNDTNGNLWMPFRVGIMKISEDDLFRVMDGSLDKVNCKVFNSHDGMLVSECIPTTKALVSSKGDFYFCTVDGLAVINPNDDKVNNYVPNVIVEEVKTDKTIADLSVQPIVFEPGIKRYTIKYTALSLYEPSKVQFKYLLEGFDNEWITVENIRSVSYTNLPHGDYTFLVKASNNDGIWNEEGAQLKFTIKARFVESTTFYIIILIVSFSLVYLFYVFRISQLKTKQETLEQMVSERNHEVLEKNKALEQQKAEKQKQNDVLLSQKAEIENQSKELEKQKEELKESIKSKDKIFSIISHDLRSPLGNIQNMLTLLIDKSEQFNPEKKSRILENLAEITKSTFYLLDNLLSWSRSQRGLIIYDPQMFLVAPLIQEIMSLTKPMAEKKNIEIVSRIDESDLAFGDINMVKTIFRNFIENALKFTPENGKVEIFDVIRGDRIEFGVQDNGIGMSEDTVYNLINNKEIDATFGTNREKGSGLGLLLCKEFIIKNQGTFSIESNLGKGSTLYFSLKRFQL
ncbi:MAG: two-component regulator propeller domain-containing protein [Prolixibacteraceae bacterium]